MLIQCSVKNKNISAPPAGRVYLVEVMIDGLATKFFADRWSEEADPAQKAALFNSADVDVLAGPALL